MIESWGRGIERIVRMIRINPKTILATRLSRRGVEYNLNLLKKKGKITRVGSTKSGFWQIIDKNV